LIIHNAPFDLRFLNHHLAEIGREPLKNEIIDTLSIARRVFSKQPCNLNSLCERFGIDLKDREDKHGALIDTKLLIKVY